jgi:thiol-disulfide isomerase/thioredoxin
MAASFFSCTVRAMATGLPSFSLADASGEIHRFPSRRPALLAFMEADCPTCNLGAPLLEAAHRALSAGMDVRVVMQDAPEDHDFARQHALSMPVLDDSALKVSYAFDIETVPTLVLADSNGEQVERLNGFDREQWRKIFSALASMTGLEEPAVDWSSYPEMRPGCGSRSVDPAHAERLRAEAEGSPIRARRLEIGEADDVFEFMFDQGLTDGLPVVPPTPERVLRMLAPATVEKVAINTVMAGCRPEYLPVVLAAVEAACTDEFNAHGVMATTMGASPVIIVNGPVRNRIGMNGGISVLGQGNRANATIGRALRLVLRNVGGARPGGTERSTIGTPMKYALSFPELEERSPWEPYHVEHGFRPEDSIVTLIALTAGPQLIVDQSSRTARALAGSIAVGVEAVGHPKASAGDTLLVVCPEHVDTLWRDGMTKAELRQRVVEVTTRPMRDRLSSDDIGGGLRARGLTEEQLMQPVPKFRNPANLHIVVAGAEAGKFSAVMAGWVTGPVGSTLVHRKIDD